MCTRSSESYFIANVFEKWQTVVDNLSRHITVVQVGQKTDRKLNNCIDLQVLTLNFIMNHSRQDNISNKHSPFYFISSPVLIETLTLEPSSNFL